MKLQTVKLAGKKFVIVPEKDFQRMNKALNDAAAQDRADIRLAQKRLADPKQKPISYEKARKELGLS
jgi:hypothetical protein